MTVNTEATKPRKPWNWTSRLECRLFIAAQVHNWVRLQVLHVGQLQNPQNLFLCHYIGFLVTACFLYVELDLKFFTKYLLYLDPKRSLAMAAFPVITKESKRSQKPCSTSAVFFLLKLGSRGLNYTMLNILCTRSRAQHMLVSHTAHPLAFIG